MRSRTRFQSTLPGWGATIGDDVFLRGDDISIHAPRMGSDSQTSMSSLPSLVISIHAPRMGSDMVLPLTVVSTVLFQSTLPGWGATRQGVLRKPRLQISIHAPRMGSDFTDRKRTVNLELFQSTLPGWGATPEATHEIPVFTNFNPRSPDGERQRKWTSSPTIWAKLSIVNTDCIADRR